MTKRHNTANDSGEFNLGINADGTWNTGTIQCALLADIRRELWKLNTLLHCHNAVAMPRTLVRIDKRLAMHMPIKKKGRA